MPGCRETLDVETDLIRRPGLRSASPGELADSSAPVLEWLKETGARHLAIHLDLDVLDPAFFRSLLFARPDAPADAFGIAQGKMTIDQVVRLLGDVAAVDVVGLGVAEHPASWDALALKNMLAKLPLLGSPAKGIAMKALVVSQFGPKPKMAIEERSIPQMKPGHTLVKKYMQPPSTRFPAR